MSTRSSIKKFPVKTFAPLFALLLGCLLFQGCALHRQPRMAAGIAPKRVPELSSQAKLDDLIKNVNDAEPPVQRRMRNDKINKIIIAINNNYDNYKNALYAGRATFDTFADFVSLALTGATAVTGSAGTKAALGAAATGVTGAHSSVNKNFFNDQSRDAIFNVMDSLRADVLGTIQDRKKQPYDQYSMSDALVDLENYYSIGTVTAARNAVSAASSTSSSNPAPPQTPGLAVSPGQSPGSTALPNPAPSPSPSPSPSPTPAPDTRSVPQPPPSPSPSPSPTPAPTAQPSPSPAPQARFADRLRTAIKDRAQQQIQ